jgi:ATP-dependent RNA helicase RhlE
MPKEVAHLVNEVLHDPVRVEVTPAKVTAELIEQRVYFAEVRDKRDLLHSLLRDAAMSRVIVFTRTKHGANKVADQLDKSGIRSDAIHGNKSQNARQRALDDFRQGRIRVLVATDIAARGIDIDGITHVVNYELPNIAESYVHRIGRTARAGAGGIAISFCASDERPYLRDIERLVKQPIKVIGEMPPPSANVQQQQPRSDRRPDHAKPRNKNRFRGRNNRRAA